MMANGIQRALAACVVALFLVGATSIASAEEFSATVRNRVRSFVAAGADGPVDSIFVPPLGDFGIVGIDAESVHIELSTRARRPFQGAVAVNVTISDDVSILKRGVVTADIQTSKRVWVATRRLERGAKVTPNDFRLERISRRSIPSGAISDISEIEGLQLDRSMREGDVVRRRYLEPISLVERGQIVRMILRGAGFEIVGKGKAVTDGILGEQIRVINSDSRREVLGRVGQDGAVYVDL